MGKFEEQNALFVELEDNIADEATAREKYYRLLSKFGYLLDKSEIDDIREIISEFDEIKCCHDIRSRGSENSVHIDMHIHLDANTTVEVAHKLSHDIEDRIKEKINENAQVIIHIEPYPGYCRL